MIIDFECNYQLFANPIKKNIISLHFKNQPTHGAEPNNIKGH